MGIITEFISGTALFIYKTTFDRINNVFDKIDQKINRIIYFKFFNYVNTVLLRNEYCGIFILSLLKKR